MKRAKRFFALAVTNLVFAVSASAFDYNEAVQGDIDDHGNKGSPPLFVLDSGENLVQASASLSYITPYYFDGDLFRFRVPHGMVLHLDSVVFEYSITEMFGDLRSLATSMEIGEGVPNRNSEALYGVGTQSYPMIFLFSDGSFPFQVSPSPVIPSFFEILNFTLDESRPAPPLLPAGDYWFSPGINANLNEPSGATWNYSFRLNLSQAP